MVDVANYAAVEALRDGRHVEIHAFKPNDRADLESALARTSSQSLYRRFFTVKRSSRPRAIGAKRSAEPARVKRGQQAVSRGDVARLPVLSAHRISLLHRNRSA